MKGIGLYDKIGSKAKAMAPSSDLMSKPMERKSAHIEVIDGKIVASFYSDNEDDKKVFDDFQSFSSYAEGFLGMAAPMAAAEPAMPEMGKPEDDEMEDLA